LILFFPPCFCELAMLEEGVSDHRHKRMTVNALPGSSPGKSTRRMTGYKGHGTKIYYNSEHVEVLSYDGQSSLVYCRMVDPRGELAVNKMPKAEIETLGFEALKQRREAWGFGELGLGYGTSIRVLGYHQNTKSGLEHDRLRDFFFEILPARQIKPTDNKPVRQQEHRVNDGRSRSSVDAAPRAARAAHRRVLKRELDELSASRRHWSTAALAGGQAVQGRADAAPHAVLALRAWSCLNHIDPAINTQSPERMGRKL
jgi:hypothetical protein